MQSSDFRFLFLEPFPCGGLALAGNQVPTHPALSLLFLNWTLERKYNGNLVNQDKDRERAFTNYYHRQNRFDLGTLAQFLFN